MLVSAGYKSEINSSSYVVRGEVYAEVQKEGVIRICDCRYYRDCLA